MNLSMANKRNIPRILISKRIKTNPNKHREPLNGYFNKVKRNNSLLNAEQPIDNQSRLQEYRSQSNATKEHDLGYFNQFNSTANSFKVLTNFEQKRSKSKFANTNQQKLEKGNKSILVNLNSFQTKEQTRQVNMKEYMSYFQYQNLIQQGSMQPDHFQKLACKNDEKAQAQLSKSTQGRISKSNRQPSKRKQKITKLKSEFIFGIESLLQKHKRKNIRLENLQAKQPIRTIISSNLGVLSNHSIKEKLQEKWERQRKTLTTNQLIVTEQSELASEKQTRQISVREDLYSGSLKKKFVKGSQNEGSAILEIESLPSQQHKTRLKRIFTKKERPVLTDENLSRGEEYESLEQSMSKINLYKPKKIVLKHKIQWKV